MKRIVCRINKNHMQQFEKMDGFVVFNFSRKLDGRRFGTYEISIRKLSKGSTVKCTLIPSTKTSSTSHKEN